MRFAIVSDIHSNLEALTTAFGLIDQESVDEVVCLGDIVGYGANPNECVRLVRERCHTVLRGNHDAAAVDSRNAETFTRNARIAAEWTGQQLSEENREFLRNLPYTHAQDDILFVHSSPHEPKLWYYVLTEEDLEVAFQSFSEKICFIGHSHFPGIFSEDGPAKAVNRGSKFLVNVGSVGQPRDGNSKLSFGIFDSDAWNYENIRSPYPIRIAAEKILQAGLPRALSDRLALGM